MPLLLLIVIFNLIGGVLSVLGAAIFLLLKETQRDWITPKLVSFAIGTLLGASFLSLLPHAVMDKTADIHAIFITVLGGLIFFFLLEKLVLWRHCHATHEDQHLHTNHHSAGSLILVGDGVHNFID
ncbi:MAG: ZIP family metal transporter, partial [Gammaproteobacteria bacterium]|nr:ZIP family metal transporter [Gammaproteobacteria bacterium]